MKPHRLLPPAVLLVSILLMTLFHLLLPVLKLNLTGLGALGAVFLSLGIVINLVADNAFKQNETTVKPFQESSVLITKGIFRWSRNPMYLGFVLMIAGIALILGSLTPFLVVIGLPVFLQQYYIIHEEKLLEQTFKTSWIQYKSQVRRWI